MFGLQYTAVLWTVLFELSITGYNGSTVITVATLRDFIELHFTNCSSWQLCSIRNNQSLFAYSNEVCCYYCSCEKECEYDDTCCPDLFIRDAIGNMTITDAKTWRQKTQHLNYITIFPSSKDIHQEEYGNVYDCVDSRLVSRDCLTSPIITNVYQMVAVCLNLSSADSIVRQLCTVSGQEYIKTMIESNSSDLDAFVRIMTPVTSLISKITFKNIYCLACSDEGISEGTYINWEAFILGKSLDWIIQSIVNENSYDIVAKMLTINNDFCITMKPPKSIHHLTPRKCNPPVIKTCPLGTDERLDLFCRNFNLPVTLKNKGELKIYQNIACYFCNRDKPKMQVCRTYQESDDFAGVSLNFLSTKGLLAAHLRRNTSYNDTTEILDCPNNVSRIATENSTYCYYNSSDQKLTENSKLTDLQKLSSAYCNRNIQFERCGEVMCPMFFYLSHGECIPTFVSFAGLYFTIALDVKVKATLTLTKTRLMIVLPVIFEYLDKLAITIFSEYSFDIWYAMEKEVLRNIVVILNFISRDPDFVSVINTTDIFLCKMADLRFETPLGIVDLGFSVTKAYTYYFMDSNTRMPYLMDGYGWKFELYKRGLPLNMVLKQFKISKAMGCYRVELEQLFDSTGFGYPQLDNSKVISINTWNLTTDLIKYITCLVDVLPTGLSMSETFMFSGFAGKILNEIEFNRSSGIDREVLNPIESNKKIDTGTNKLGKTASTFSFGTREAVITAVLVSVAIILITVRMCKKRISSNSNTVANNVELQITPQ